MLVKVEGTKFVRDTKSMGLINTDSAEKNEYLLKSKLLKTQKDEINNLKAQVSNVESELSQIKELLLKVLEK